MEQVRFGIIQSRRSGESRFNPGSREEAAGTAQSAAPKYSARRPSDRPEDRGRSRARTPSGSARARARPSSASTTSSLDTPPARPKGTRSSSSKQDLKGGYSSGSVPPRVPSPRRPAFVPQTGAPPPVVPQTAPPRKKTSSSARDPKGSKPFGSARPRVPSSPSGHAGTQTSSSPQDPRESHSGNPAPPPQTTARHTKPYISDSDDDDASRFGAGYPRLPTSPGSRRPLVPLEPSRRQLKRAEEVSKFFAGLESGVWEDDGPRDRRRRRNAGRGRE
jgi:hypothetical protein